MPWFHQRTFVGAAVVVLLIVAEAACAFSVAGRSLSQFHAKSYQGYTFEHYVEEFNKHYESHEELIARKKAFEKNLALVKSHNSAGNSSYVMGVNHMTDWTEEEFNRLNGARPQMRRHVRNKRLHTEFVPKRGVTLPYEVDYRTAVPPVLTAIKNQGRCGSCWAHSAVEAIESHTAITHGKLYVLSQQQLTSCTPNPDHCGGTGGCFGSTEALAFEYAAGAGGLAEEWDYSYTSYHGDSGTCKDQTSQPVVHVKGFVSIPKNDQKALLEAVATVGPIAVGVDASKWSGYAGGVFDGCGDYSVANITKNHAVQLVGYGHDPATNKDYWIIRNSWGPRWGENGYMRLLREENPSCGWSDDAHSDAACDGDPDEEWVCGMCGVLSGATYPLV